jgi:type IV secretory pathway VirB4 component
MEKETVYTTIRVTREVRIDIDKIAANHWKETGEKLEAGQVVEKAIHFLIVLIDAPKSKLSAALAEIREENAIRGD